MGHSFPVRNDFYTLSKNRNNIKRDINWPSHFKRFKLQHKDKKLTSLTHSTFHHVLKTALIKSASDSLREIFIQWV